MAHRDLSDIAARYPEALRPNLRRRMLWVGGTLALILYAVYIWTAFDIGGAIARAEADRAQILALDSYAHKIHVDFAVGEPPEPRVTVEGSRFQVYETLPDWVRRDGDAWIIAANAGYEVRFDGRLFTLREGPSQLAEIEVRPEGPLLRGVAPDWMKVADNKIEGRPDLYFRFIITTGRVQIHNYFTGWENFWFDWNSPLRGYGFFDAMGLVLWGERLVPETSNLALAASEFWTNQDWQHGEVFDALLVTVLMAVLGTILAALCALPLAFLAANNINPFVWLRAPVKRFFDFLRGVDSLIWSLIFIRAFGLGPLSGVLALWFTDTGTLGKLFSEAIENADRKQIEGLQATGATPVQRTWYGVIPQIMPVFISQSLYFFESNTRSATVIGMLGAGGIGLKLADTMRTGQDWENTAYIILLTILIVIAIDSLSVWLRRRLIEGT